MYVATDELLARYGVQLRRALERRRVPHCEVRRSPHPRRRLVRCRGSGGPTTRARRAPRGLTRYTSVPDSFVTYAEAQRRGWVTQSSGRWLVEAVAPITNDQLGAARRAAASFGMTIESRDHQTGLAALRSGATAVGMLLALTILAMTVGLIRTEARGETRTLAATGATGFTRRSMTATTAGGLALLGVVLGTAGAYVTLWARRLHHLGDVHTTPFLQTSRSSRSARRSSPPSPASLCRVVSPSPRSAANRSRDDAHTRAAAASNPAAGSRPVGRSPSRRS